MSHAPATVVLEDDAPDTVAMVSDLLSMLGLRAVHGPPGPPTAACITQHHPPVVILDVLFAGGLTGIDLLPHLRVDPRTWAVSIVCFTESQYQLQNLLPDYPAHGATFVRTPAIEQLSTHVEDLVHQAPYDPLRGTLLLNTDTSGVVVPARRAE